MDRESDHEDLEHRDRDRNGNDNGDGSEESDIDQRSPFIQSDRRNQAIEEETMDFPAEAVGRMLKSVTGGRPMHRTTSASGICSSSTGNLISSAGFMNSNSQLTNERLFQYNYLSQQQQQQQMNSNYPQSHYPPLQLQSVAAVAALMQQSAAIAAASANSFQSVPPSELSSSQTLPCSQKQQPSPSNSYETSPSNFQSLASAHVRRSASVSSRQSGEEPTVAQNSWSFEEQFKQLYDIDRDDPERKKFLDDLFSFMQKHGDPRGKIETPVTRLPIMAKSVLDLYELYKLVVQRGGLVDVINKKLWQEVIKGLNLPSSITSAAFTLRTQYVKFLYQYECAKLNLSNENELKAAIEGNKREGRRTSYPYGDLGHVQSPNQQHHQQHHHNSNSVVSSSNGTTMSSLHHLIGQSQPPQPHHQGSPQISPVSLVSGRPPQLNGHGHSMSSFGIASNASHVNTASSLPSSIPNAHCVPSLMLQGTTVPDVRILDYIKFFNGLPINGAGTSPELPDANSLNNMHMTQLEFWNLYNGLVKSSVQTNARDTMPTTAATSQVQSSTSGVNEAPLDLGKRRATDSLQSSNSSSSLPPPTKKEALDSDQDDENEDGEESSVSDSDSNDDDPEKNSSQDIAELTKATNPFVVRMKINGIRYKGIMRPIITNNNRSTNWNIREC